MAKRKNILLLFLLIVSSLVPSIAQLDMKIGSWKSYLPYQTGSYVTQSETHVYYATDFSLMIMDKEDKSVELLSKVEGLSEAGMGEIKYDPFNQVLILSLIHI